MFNDKTLDRRQFLKTIGIATSIAVATPVLSACGGGGTTGSTGTGGDSGQAGGAGSISLEIGSDGNRIAYNRDTLTAKAGQEVTLTFNNNSDSIQHNWVLADGGNDVAAQIAQDGQAAGVENDYIPQDTSNIIAHTSMLNGGESEEITFTAPNEPGEYTYLCTFPGHFQAGMKGTLVVGE